MKGIGKCVRGFWIEIKGDEGVSAMCCSPDVGSGGFAGSGVGV